MAQLGKSARVRCALGFKGVSIAIQGQVSMPFQHIVLKTVGIKRLEDIFCLTLSLAIQFREPAPDRVAEKLFY